MTFDAKTVSFIIVGTLLMIGNFCFLRWGMTFLSKKLEFKNEPGFYTGGQE